VREVLLISHELRTPLSVISGYLSLLDEHEFSPEQRAEIRRVMREAVAELERTIEVLISRERRIALAYGLTIPELVEPTLYRSREEILAGMPPLGGSGESEG
jgi:signal transduction histidine kinase